jgi:two-component system, OmpR family, sensor histidine kinase CiaH
VTRQGPGTEAALLRRTRLRLIAWSAGSTLVVLVVLGVAIYVAAASSLASGGVAQLESRVREFAPASAPVTVVGGPPVFGTGVGVTSDPAQPGVLIGGSASGTIAFVVTTGPGSAAPMVGSVSMMGEAGLMPDPEVIAAAQAGGTVIRETTIGSAPVRVLVASVGSGASQTVAVVIGDRTAEVDTLRTLLIVLLVGGLAVLAVSVAVGYVYAGRALVPIRESLRRQREFTADASHELRTPLTITRAAIAELRRGRDDPAVVDRAIDDLDAGAGRLELLVDDLLLLARADADAVALLEADTDLALAAAEASEALDAVAALRGVRLTLDVEPAPLRGDEARLRQLAGILVDNAIRHSPDGGRVTVTVRAGAVLTVDDEGPGIEPEHAERVFERFWRAPDSPPGGTGLGLAIARWIVERHRGTITAGNRLPTPGARFTVRIPGG